MSDTQISQTRPADPFDAGHGRLSELRATLGIAGPTEPSRTEAHEARGSRLSRRPAKVAGAAPRDGAREARGRGFDPRNPADLLLVVLWTSMLGLLAAAILATN